MPEPVLTPGDRQTAVWQKISKYLEAELDRLRKQNDKPALPEDTARLRGRIAAVKDLLALGIERKPQPSEDDGFKD
jgi:ribosomal protein L30/L7E